MFGYYNDGIFKMITNKFKKLFEQDNIVIHKPTKQRKELNKNSEKQQPNKKKCTKEMNYDNTIEKTNKCTIENIAQFNSSKRIDG